MKLANYDGRAAVVCGDSIADVYEVSGGRFGPDPMRVFDDWPAFAAFAGAVTNGTTPLVEAKLARPGADAAPSVRDRAQLPDPRRGIGHGDPRRARDLYEIPGIARGAVRRRRDCRRNGRLGS